MGCVEYGQTAGSAAELETCGPLEQISGEELEMNPSAMRLSGKKLRSSV